MFLFPHFEVDFLAIINHSEAYKNKNIKAAKVIMENHCQSNFFNCVFECVYESAWLMLQFYGTPSNTDLLLNSDSHRHTLTHRVTENCTTT